jgi:cystathionine gamma-synthase
MVKHMSENDDARLGTLCVWGGETEKNFWLGAVEVPVVNSVTFGYKDVDKWLAVAKGLQAGHIYSRNTNPTVAVFEEKMRRLEKAEAATSFSTGMAAISNTFFALLSAGDRVVSITDTYGGVSKIFLEFFPRFGIKVTLCKTEDYDAIEREVEKGCKLLYLESPTNPTLKIVDIRRLANFAHKFGSIVAVDNTFATPINQRPIELGADLVIHSATKFLSGHSDAMGGVVCGKKELVDKIFHFREINGASLNPVAAYMLIRGIKTLHLRVSRQNDNAMQIAKFLESHPMVEKVFYPGLPSHKYHEVARRQMSGFGGILSFQLKGGFEAVRLFLPRLRYAHLAANLGSVETITGPPATTSHVECSPEEREALGIPESLIRYSVGIEDVKDLIADLEQALDYLKTAI